MKIVVINGSPKGTRSVTLHYARLIGLHYPVHEIEELHVSQYLARLERNRGYFDRAMAAIADAGLVIWAAPVYIALVPSQLKRFIELIFERGAPASFAGKYAAALTTSIHFYDHIAHRYLCAVNEDLGLRWLGSYSAAMYDLLHRKERGRLIAFAGEIIAGASAGRPTARRCPPLPPVTFRYRPGPVRAVAPLAGRKALILVDQCAAGSNLAGMVGHLQAALSGPVELCSLQDLDLRWGCRGCLRCGPANRCIYRERDGFHIFFEEKIRRADLLFFAGAIKDRYLSARWKMFFDRSFYLNHIPYLEGRQIGFIIAGPLGLLPYLQQALDGFVQMHGANLSGFVSDEVGEGGLLDRLLEDLAARAARCAATGYVAPSTFLGEGGRKIFRDFIWGPGRLVFPADHRYYISRGLYNFPQKRQSALRLRVLELLLSIPRARREMTRRMRKEMVKPFRGVLRREKERLAQHDNG